MPIPEISRRVFLSRSLQGAALVAAAPLAPTGCTPALREGLRTDGLAVLTPRELQILDAAADAFVPEGGAFAAGARGTGVARHVDALLADEAPDVVRGLGDGLWLLEWAGPLLAGRLPRFTGLDLDGRTRVLAALRTSRIGLARELYAGLRQLCLFVFYCRPEGWAATGYDGPWIGRETT